MFMRSPTLPMRLTVDTIIKGVDNNKDKDEKEEKDDNNDKEEEDNHNEDNNIKEEVDNDKRGGEGGRQQH